MYPKVLAFPGNEMQILLTQRTLGRGMFGTVHYAHLKDDPNEVYAVKVINRRSIRGKKAHENLVNEIEILTEIKN